MVVDGLGAPVTKHTQHRVARSGSCRGSVGLRGLVGAMHAVGPTVATRFARHSLVGS